MEPAPIDKTASNLPGSESRPNAGNKGCMIEEAVIIATVEEPCAVLRIAVNINGNKSPNACKLTALLTCCSLLAVVYTSRKKMQWRVGSSA